MDNASISKAMSGIVTVKISEEAARQLIAQFEKELEELRQVYDQKRAQLSEFRRALNGEEKPDSKSGNNVARLVVSKNPDSGRAPKGQSYGVIKSFLESHKGSGWSPQEISDKTGTSLSTTIRVLSKLNEEGVLDRVDGKWGIGA